MKKLNFKINWDWVKTSLIKFLKDKLVKTILKKILGSATALGWQAWIIKYFVTEIYDEALAPRIKAIFAQIGFKYNVYKGGIQIERIKEARENDDEEQYNSTIDDIFNRR